MSTWQPVAEALMRERYRSLVAYAYLLERDQAAAEDLVQDALVRTFTRSARFGGVPQAEAYVRRAIASCFIDGARARKRRSARERWVSPVEAIVGHASAVEGDADLAAAMASLAPRVRACVALRYLADQSLAQTADALHLSQGTVKRYVHEGVRALAIALGTPAEADHTSHIDDAVDVVALRSRS
jgi:RNA polymerase sigma factor (sigma-70 family)